MARGRSFDYYVRQVARSARKAEAHAKRQQREREKTARDQERLNNARLRELERQARESVKAQKELEKLQKQMYLESRVEETENLNNELNETLEAFKNLLLDTLDKDDTINFDALKPDTSYPSFDPPFELVTANKQPDESYFTQHLVAPSGLGKLIPGAQKRYEESLKKAKAEISIALQKYQEREDERLAKLAGLNELYNKEKLDFLNGIVKQHQEVDDFQKLYFAGEVESVVTYNSMILERSEYPENFPHQYRVAYAPESRELVVELDLPKADIIPAVLEYKYTKTKDTIEGKPRKANEIKEIYQDVVAALTLRTIHEIFEADQGNLIDLIAFNGIVDTIDPGTGNSIRPCIITVRVTKEEFSKLNLRRVDKFTCLRNLKAQVSSRPDEVLPVKPVVEFDMVDKRFVEQVNVLGGLDVRPNLMDLNPTEFENLVGNLFTQMGLDTKLTRSSRDGGVDAVAFDTRPVIGGKVVIQAKRYKHTVGVSAVRDLYGTMMNEGANKGILVATSGYGTDAYTFAKDKPIELIDGSGLLYLLEQVGVNAKIVIID